MANRHREMKLGMWLVSWFGPPETGTQKSALFQSHLRDVPPGRFPNLVRCSLKNAAPPCVCVCVSCRCVRGGHFRFPNFITQGGSPQRALFLDLGDPPQGDFTVPGLHDLVPVYLYRIDACHAEYRWGPTL